MSARRLGVLVRELSADSALSRALNDGQPPWKLRDHLLADIWVVLVKIFNRDSKVSDHPRRAEMQAKANKAARLARVSELAAKFQKRKKTYGLG